MQKQQDQRNHVVAHWIGPVTRNLEDTSSIKLPLDPCVYRDYITPMRTCQLQQLRIEMFNKDGSEYFTKFNGQFNVLFRTHPKNDSKEVARNDIVLHFDHGAMDKDTTKVAELITEDGKIWKSKGSIPFDVTTTTEVIDLHLTYNHKGSASPTAITHLFEPSPEINLSFQGIMVEQRNLFKYQ